MPGGDRCAVQGTGRSLDVAQGRPPLRRLVEHGVRVCESVGGGQLLAERLLEVGLFDGWEEVDVGRGPFELYQGVAMGFGSGEFPCSDDRVLDEPLSVARLLGVVGQGGRVGAEFGEHSVSNNKTLSKADRMPVFSEVNSKNSGLNLCPLAVLCV